MRGSLDLRPLHTHLVVQGTITDHCTYVDTSNTTGNPHDTLCTHLVGQGTRTEKQTDYIVNKNRIC
jgi:hypothetical protein